MVSFLRALSVGTILVASLTACSSGANDGDSATSTSASSSVSSAKVTPTSTDYQKSSTQGNSSGKDIIENAPQSSWQDALNKAQAKFEGKPAKIELEHDDSGALVYKIELISGTEKRAMQYSANDLTELSDKKKTLDDDKDRNKSFDVDNVIPLDRAVDTARNNTSGDITSWKIEGKDTGRVQYEFDILPSGSGDDVEVQVNAMDGSLLK